MKKDAGFTILELLIVLAVVVILALFLIPNLVGARDKAHDTASIIYGRNMLTHATAWLADEPTHKVSDLQTACLDATYVAEGAESIFPVSVSACEVQKLGADAYGIKVTSRTGNEFQFRN
ncbi:type II secretion system protein [Deinococcus sp. AJ005]|uniref:type II secretion system protein n=1 Tax=Deinococcus sp. AJ005 TaxID=2652443 RepID=UPI00125CBEDE|nr:type II secretion system protein [Deinococcus sp. AJ005]QFP77962.1 type II secretion system protein [Deinococcus sp. AJ005]